MQTDDYLKNISTRYQRSFAGLTYPVTKKVHIYHLYDEAFLWSLMEMVSTGQKDSQNERRK